MKMGAGMTNENYGNYTPKLSFEEFFNCRETTLHNVFSIIPFQQMLLEAC